MQKPTLFIASSVEGIKDLITKASSVDFAVFAFAPDDLTTIRDHQVAVARDNVVFELGLFVGSTGLERCYIVKPRGVDMHLPTDLLGMNTADYVPDRSDNGPAQRLNQLPHRVPLKRPDATGNALGRGADFIA